MGTSSEGMQEEHFPPPPNLPPDKNLAGKASFLLRKTGDLMMASVVQELTPWLLERSGSILEVGCGAQPYRHLIPSSCTYKGLDWEQTEIHFGYKVLDTVYYDGKEFPFPDDMFDSVFHTEVLEHVYHYESFLKECQRVLKPGGFMFLAVPFQARYHYIPFDFWRFTPAALEIMLIDAGFKEIEISSRGNDITVAAYKNVSLVCRWLHGKLIEKVMGLVVSPFALASLLVGHISLKMDIGSKDDCLGYIVTSRA